MKSIFKVRLLEQWQSYLCSHVGGALAHPRAKEYARVVERYLRYHDIHLRPADIARFISNDHLIDYFDHIGSDKGPSWKCSVILTLRRFLIYLDDRDIVPAGLSHRFKLLTKGLVSSLGKQKTRRRVEQQAEKRPRLLKIDLSDFFLSPRRRDALRQMAESVNTDTYQACVKYLAGSLILNSGARTGVLANLKMSEVFNAEKCVFQTSSDDVAKHYFVVSVSHHKTSYHGPV